MLNDKMQRVRGPDGPTLKELPKGAELYQASVEHDGELNETKVSVMKFLFQEYERRENKTEVEVDEDYTLVTVVDERFPNVPIKHQSLESFFATPNEAVTALYGGVARAESILAKYIIDNYGEAVRDEVYRSVSAFED